MPPTRFALLLAAACFATGLAAATPAFADNKDWDDQACTLAAGATRLDAGKAIQIGEALGYTIGDYEIDDGCIELKGHDANGAQVKLRLDPASGAVLPYRR